MGTGTSFLHRIDADRSERLRYLMRPSIAEVERALLGRVREVPALREAIARGVAVATSLSYHHPGQDAKTYLAHPMRVASLYIDLVDTPSAWGVTVALLHNVLEVADVEVDTLTSAFGRATYDALVLLTVNRDLQWDELYKNAYYEAIGAAPSAVGAVKVLDKVDNLYLLPLNADDDVRARYLAEIERWVLPLAEQCVSAAVPLMQELVIRSRAIGHRSLQAWSLE